VPVCSSRFSRHQRHRDEILAVLERLGPATVWDITGELTWSRGWNQVTGLMRRAAVAETAAHVDYLQDAGALVGTDRSGAEPVRYTVTWPSGDRLGTDRTR